MAEVDVDRFYSRLSKLYSHFRKHKNYWSGANSLTLHRGNLNDDEPYAKSVVLHQWLFGYELPDTIVVLTKDATICVLATKKKCEFLRPAVGKNDTFKIKLLLRNKEDGNAENYKTLLETAKQGDENNNKIGTILKERNYNKENGSILGPYEKFLDEQEGIELVDIAPALCLVMAAKDETEWDLMKKSSVLSNKVMKHGFVKRLEEIIEDEKKITHEEFATEIESILEDPNKIKLNVPSSDVQSCYFPIVQSGGTYDIRVSAQSSSEKLKHDIITVSLGSRYKLYCSNVARTFLVDPPKKVSATYEVLLEMQEACLKAMQPGNQLKAVYKAAVQFLNENGHEELISKLPKNLGFAQGLDFRDSTLTLTAKNNVTFKPGMVFCLAVGFQDLELTPDDVGSTPSASPVKKLNKYALLVSDMVSISKGGKEAEILTKMGKNITDIAYNVNDDDDGSEDDDASEDSDSDPDAALAKKLSRESEADAGGRRSRRLASGNNQMAEAAETTAERERRQIKLMIRRNEDRVREIARNNLKNKGKRAEDEMAEELEAYKSTKEYPSNVQPNQVKVDMVNQCIILPIFGNPVPFHISTIKNVVLPDPDNATLLRINFYTAGMAVGKDAPTNTAKLVQKYGPYASFVRELTFRSLDGHNLVQAFRQISELRKRARAREIQEMEEANLVEQEKLVRTKNERVPRLSDLTMRPVFAGRKTQGNLEAHTNGLRFISTRREVVDVMYNNIKYAIFQPCEKEIMVLIHFHLKNPIMVGSKKQTNVQFFTEVVEASQAVDNGRRSMYDPDEMDDEQRERQLRKRLNQAFKDFCKKVDGVAKKNGYRLEFDIPYRDLGFTGNPHKEMVQLLPTLNCLVNLTETPFFVVDLDHVDHVHFERVHSMSKAFDVILINKDFTKMPQRIDMIPNGDKDGIQEWLTDMEITYTEGPMNLNWKQILSTAKDDDRFYMTTEDDEVTEKEAGWEILRMFGREDEEDDDEDEEDSEFGEQSDELEEEEEEEPEEDFDSEEESDFDADEELEEQGMDWDEMEFKAAAEDKRKRQMGDEVVQPQRNKRRGSQSNGGGKRRRR